MSEAITTSQLFKALQANRARVASTNADERLAKIRKLGDAVLRHRQDIRDALKADMNAPETETDIVEVYRVISEVRHAEKHLRDQMRTKSVPTPMALLGTSAKIQYEPKGVCLIMSPWNFPFDLTINPLIAAVGAGNCVMIKPSEVSPNSSALLQTIVSEVFPENEVCVVQGDVSVATEVLRLPFNHVYFTGAPSIGKVVMRAAAEHLASVTLELGGKSPVVVDETADINKAALRIAGAKNVKCGQMCITADYVLVHESRKQALVEALGAQFDRMLGATDEARLTGDNGCIISDKHFARVLSYLEDAKAKGATVAYGGSHHAAQRFITPTILTDVTDDMLVMQEEIFGPLLPVMTYKNISEVVDYVNQNHKPLSLYIFSKNKQTQSYILNNTSAGGVTINGVGLHPLNNNLPFGGVNNSGIGKGHGAFGFQEFSNAKAIMSVPPFAGVDMLFAPYGERAKQLVNTIIKWF